MDTSIHPVTEADHDWLLEIIRGWGADFIVSRGRKIYPTEIEGFYIADETGKRIGLVTFEIVGNQCEVVTLNAFIKFSGLGTQLLKKAEEVARKHGCRRLWLITTNDNLDAIHFYQRRGMTIAAVHLNALVHSRKLKPSIPKTGQHGIPLHDEIEFEMVL